MTGCRLKPGSLTASGIVIGILPVRSPLEEPVIVPANYGVSIRHTMGRCRLLEQAGWVMCPAALYPRIIERDEAVLIHRDSWAYRQFLRTPLERRRHGAARP